MELPITVISVNTDANKGPIHCWWEFNSADEFIRQSCEGKNADGWNYWDAFTGTYDSFYECASVVDARNTAEHGFAKGREAVARLKAKIENRIGRRSKTFEVAYDVVGAAVDVGVYLSGEPECMLAFEEVDSTQEQFVDIHFSSGVSAGVDTESMVRNGAAVCALVDALEEQGKRVRLSWERSSSVDQPGKKAFTTVSVWVLLKDYSDVLDMDRIAFFCTSPIARRALAWSIDSQCPMEVVREMGIPKGIATLGTYPANNPKYRTGCDVYVPAMIAQTEQGTAEWVLGELKRLGVDIAPSS